MIQKVKAAEFISLAKQFPVLDVRSPGEYNHAHIPGAYNLPLFSDEERKIVGTIYKQESREQAVKAGLDYFGVKMRRMVEEVEEISSAFQETNSKVQTTNSQFPTSNSRTVVVHCWRGGMRSAGVAWLLDLYGFKVYTLTGGYKAFRNWVLQQFEHSYPFHIIGGYTGSGKTHLLHELEKQGHCILDLERIACHKGSAFGGLGEEKQPTHEQFENNLALALHDVAERLPDDACIWLEDESRRIGDINLPKGFWETMRRAPLYFLDIPFEARLDHIAGEYGRFKKEELVNCIMRIQKRMGGLATKNAINYLLEDNYKACFGVLLAYYDKFYLHGLNEREGAVPRYIMEAATTDAGTNAQVIMNKKRSVHGVVNTGN